MTNADALALELFACMPTPNRCGHLDTEGRRCSLAAWHDERGIAHDYDTYADDEAGSV